MPVLNLRVFVFFAFFSLFSALLCLTDSLLAKSLLIAAALFALGIYGLLASNSALKSLLALELLFNGGNVALIAFGRFTDLSFFSGQAFALFVMAVAAAETALALALVVAYYRLKSSSSLDGYSELQG